MKLSTLALVLGVSFSGSAFAETDIWETSTPWGSIANAAQFVDWTQISWLRGSNPAIDSSPNDFKTGSTGTLQLTNPGRAPGVGSGGIIAGGTNVYGLGDFDGAQPMKFTAVLDGGSTTGTYDVYLRIATLGKSAAAAATLITSNGTYLSSAPTLITNIGEATEDNGVEQELYWKWTVSGSSSYTFNFAASEPHMSLDQVQLATVAAVPEPETYAMLGLGLGLVALARRRANKNNA